MGNRNTKKEHRQLNNFAIAICFLGAVVLFVDIIVSLIK
jgi:hypothetical protein